MTDSEVRCWMCGVEADEVYRVEAMEQSAPVALIIRWPAGEHPHDVRPPTLEELSEAGRASLKHIRDEWVA